jgi:hypothetical protein
MRRMLAALVGVIGLLPGVTAADSNPMVLLLPNHVVKPAPGTYCRDLQQAIDLLSRYPELRLALQQAETVRGARCVMAPVPHENHEKSHPQREVR